MFIAVDVGNTQTTLGLFDAEGTQRKCWRLKTSREDTSDDILIKLHSLLTTADYGSAHIDHAGVASVVPALNAAWNKVLFTITGKKPLTVSASQEHSIPLSIPYPQTIGADRICNAIAARTTYGAPVIVVDFGTATNIDVVDQEGAFRGGVIAPGLMLSASALFQRAAQLASIPIEAPKQAFGEDTKGALQSGLVIGTACMIEGLVGRIKDELSIQDAPVIATGGLSTVISRATDLFTEVDPSLTLRGIYTIWHDQAAVNSD